MIVNEPRNVDGAVIGKTGQWCAKGQREESPAEDHEEGGMQPI